jgi:hypothetical protein
MKLKRAISGEQDTLTIQRNNGSGKMKNGNE